MGGVRPVASSVRAVGCGTAGCPPGPADAPGLSRQRSIRQQRLLQGRPRARAGSQVAVAPFRVAVEPFRPVLFQIGVEPMQAGLFQDVRFQDVLLQDAAQLAPALKSYLSPQSPHRSWAVA